VQTPGAPGYLDATKAARRALRPPATILRQAEKEVRFGVRVIRDAPPCAANQRDAHDQRLIWADEWAGRSGTQPGLYGRGLKLLTGRDLGTECHDE
jgi:hypothetical protein